ncbi:uncharacterized protein DS421_3g93310 [Arachis hypogaea]|nr:uncharacterized protein DS421_3g93310 [Arachis hypogaea]
MVYPFASCCHSRLLASILSVGVVISILPSPPCDLSFCPFSLFLSGCWCHSEILDLQPSFLYPHPVRVSGSFLGLSQFSLSGYIVHQGYRLPSRFSVPNDPSEQYWYHHRVFYDLFAFLSNRILIYYFYTVICW